MIPDSIGDFIRIAVLRTESLHGLKAQSGRQDMSGLKALS
jgi:hypothetical protein